MALHAFDDLGDALDATRAFLSPLDPRTWLKLALVVFFVGGSGGAPTGSNFSVPSGSGAPSGGELPPLDLGPRAYLLIAAIVAVVLLVGLLFLVVGSVMEFVFVECLRTEEVTVRRYWSRRWRQGLRLFGFRVVVGLLSLAAFGLLALAVVLPFVGGMGALALVPLAIAIPVAVVLGIVSAVVTVFTTHFVVPVMVREECGVLAGWRRFWPTLRAEWKEYLAYAVVGFVLSMAGGILVGIALLLVGVVLLIPFGILGFVGFALVSVAGVVGWAVVALVALAYGLVMLVVAALVQVPVQSFLRYYALFLLGDTDADLDLVAERRAAVRE